MRAHYIVSLLILWLVSVVSAQDITPSPLPTINAEQSAIVQAFFTASNTTPRLGEPFDLTINIEAPLGVTLVGFPALPTTDPLLRIIHEGEIQSRTTDSGGAIATKTWTVTLWQVGGYLTPELAVEFIYNGVKTNNLVRSVYITVPSQVANAVDQTLRPLFAVRDLPYLPPYYIVVVIVVVLVIVLGLRSLLRRREGRIAGVLGGTPAQIAMAELEDLKTQILPAPILYGLLTEHLRTFLVQRFGVEAGEMTSVELLERVRPLLDDGVLKRLKQMLEQADLVKFARFEPDAEATLRLINQAVRWVEDADKLQGTPHD